MILMIGTDPKGQGGIASVVRNYIDAGFFEREQIQYIVSHRSGPVVIQLFAAVLAVFRLLNTLWFGKVDLVHVHCASYGSFWRKSLLLWICRCFGVPSIYHLHGGAFEEFVGAMRWAWMKRWVRHTLTRSTCVIVLSTLWRERVLKVAPQASVAVLSNSVQVSEITECEPDKRRAHGILFLGRAERTKGIFDLVDAVKLIVEKYPAIYLSVAGDGDLEALKSYIDERKLGPFVHIHGWISGDTKKLELACASILCLPAYREGLPMAILEAMAQGKVVVTTPVGAIPEVIQDGVNGLLHPPGDVAALARSLSYCFDNTQACIRLGNAARETVIQNYSLATKLDQLASIYELVKATKL